MAPTTKKKTNFQEGAFLELNRELSWLEAVLVSKLQKHTGINSGINRIYELTPPEFSNIPKEYGTYVLEHELNFAERIILILSLAPHIQPNFLDNAIYSILQSPGEFPELGGTRGQHFRGFLPTVETAIFILSDETVNRFEIQQLMSTAGNLVKNHVIEIEAVKTGEPSTSGRLMIHEEFVELFAFGSHSKPSLGTAFPAQLVETALEWDDLVLNEKTKAQIAELQTWILHHKTLMQDWEMHKRLAPGYRVLFHGPPGTGKTLTAALLGKYTGKEVYRIDLSMITSKFIGETEKNLAALFNKAENKNWILFFDEADAIFGKRTNVKDSHDKYANQEVSYLLQRIEKHAGLVILASNFKTNIDDAFTRRFNAIVYFPLPKATERLQLWKQGLPAKAKLEKAIDLSYLAKQYELSGANIMNVIQYAALQCLSRKSEVILMDDISEGVKKEFLKEGKMV